MAMAVRCRPALLTAVRVRQVGEQRHAEPSASRRQSVGRGRLHDELAEPVAGRQQPDAVGRVQLGSAGPLRRLQDAQLDDAPLLSGPGGGGSRVD